MTTWDELPNGTEDIREAFAAELYRMAADECPRHPGAPRACRICEANDRAAARVHDNGDPFDDMPPCQPIGCDNGIHLSGCTFAAIDSDPDERHAESRCTHGAGAITGCVHDNGDYRA